LFDFYSQFFKQASKELPELQNDIRNGNFKPLKEWLNAKIHNKGSLIPNGDLLTKEVTGSPLDPAVFLDHLYEKYGKLYKL
jgi:carboxypeptidase Taq